jgi:hypothetical protein
VRSNSSRFHSSSLRCLTLLARAARARTRLGKPSWRQYAARCRPALRWYAINPMRPTTRIKAWDRSRLGVKPDSVVEQERSPALTAANVGVAMGSGTDVAQESAGIVLLGNDLRKFAETVEIARWTRRIIWQNFAGTIAVDLAGMALPAAGLLDPSVAAFIHVASEMTFILNSARLLPRTRSATEPAMGLESQENTLAKAA